ncbi:MAG TPA: PA0069 family radical SAM protein [Rhizomicrobium sp.]|jgi:DNA repair photolyase|nr:PA0069 family radical SAM protein [Rhizomicrobium sp.]
MTTVLDITADPRRLRGRGAVSNAAGRYEKQARVLMDDGWNTNEEPEPSLKTEILRDTSRTIITRNTSPDISFNQSINPYKGCEHGCIYCFARPTHAYLGFSPGADFESKIFAKPNAAELLRRELSAPGYVPQVIAIGTNTDPYQPTERKLKIMRSLLEVLHEFKHPVGIVTKSALVLRDIDILAPMAEAGLAKVALSITTLNRQLARTMEPRASTPPKRLDAIRQLTEVGIPTAVMFAPVIPALNDEEMEHVLEAAKAAGARSAGYVLLRLPLEIKDLFREWLEANVPDRAKHVMSLVRSMRGGKDYDANWNTRMRGTGPYAEMLSRRFHLAVKRLGFNAEHRPLDVSQFKRPAHVGEQLALL